MLHKAIPSGSGTAFLNARRSRAGSVTRWGSCSCVLWVLFAAVAWPPVDAAAGTLHIYNVRSYGYSRTDDSSAFSAAIAAASRDGTGYASGPGGSSQGVVYVPRGVYRILNVKLLQNVRIEINARAVLMQAGGSLAHPARLFVLDGPAAAPLRNVSIVGVGASNMYAKKRKPPPAAGWHILRDFTLNLDPAATHSSALVRGIDIRNVDGFRISRVFIIQSKTDRSGRPPDSQTAAIGLSADAFSPIGGPYYDPHHGTISHVYAINEPGGYGPDQVDSAHNVNLDYIYSNGGTALRLETQASKGQYGARIDGLRAHRVMCDHGNQGVAFSPHGQDNANVSVTGVTGKDCKQAVKVSGFLEAGLSHHGNFLTTSVTGVNAIGGRTSQLTTNGAWTIGTSDRAIAIDPAATYKVNISGVVCSGPFQHQSDVPC